MLFVILREPTWRTKCYWSTDNEQEHFNVRQQVNNSPKSEILIFDSPNHWN